MLTMFNEYGKRECGTKEWGINLTTFNSEN